ncbi:MAG: hypothetical protein ABGX16_02645 [Pirellulales bacterium]
MRAGKYHVIAILRSQRGIENWTIQPMVVTSEIRVAPLTLTTDWAEPCETLSGTVKLDRPAQSDSTILLRLMDDSSRVLARKRIIAGKLNPAPFEFSIHAWMPMLLRVEAVLMEGNDEVSSAHAFFRVTNRHQNQFNFVVWNWPLGDLGPYGLKSFTKHGVTAVLQGGTPPLSLAAGNLSYVPYASSFRKSSHTVTAMLNKNGMMKGGCIHDPRVMQEWVQSTVARQQDARGHGVLVYSLGDENAVRGSCLSDHCLRAYQNYLKTIYGNVNQLNAQLDTDYVSF